MPKYKTSSHESTIKEILDCGNVLEDLHSQMEEWRENLEGNNMEHLPKYEEVSEAADALENAGSEIETYASDLSSALEKCGDLLEETVSYTLMTPYKGRSEPRWMQCANALSALQAVVAFLQDENNLVKLDEDGEPITKKGEDGEEINVLWTDEVQDLEDNVGSLSDALEEAEAVEFPGMFG